MALDRLNNLVGRCRGAKSIVAYREPHTVGEFTLRRDEYEGRKIGRVQGREEAEYVATHAKLPLVWLCEVPPALPAHRLKWMAYETPEPAPSTKPLTPRQQRNKLYGDLARERGELREYRALSSLDSAPLPTWLLWVTKATLAEDARGIDLVGHSDVGKLKVQVKGCAAAARAFKQDPRSWDIEVVVVDQHAPDEVVRAAVVDAFRRARAAVQSRSRRTVAT